jgi:hypothetical protein
MAALHKAFKAGGETLPNRRISDNKEIVLNERLPISLFIGSKKGAAVLNGHPW